MAARRRSRSTSRSRRFGYAGEWGYQSTLDDGTPPTEVFPFLHVGARYYDPATGRFLQRDPIGIEGGRNVYVYATNGPTTSVDPTGTDEFGYWNSVYNDNLADYRSRRPPRPAPPKPPLLATIIIFVTGGEDSWLDDPRKVKKVQKWLYGVSLVCASVSSPLPPAVKAGLGITGMTANLMG